MKTPTGHHFGETYKESYAWGVDDEPCYAARCIDCSLIRRVVRTLPDGRRVFTRLPGGAFSIKARCIRVKKGHCYECYR